MTTTHSVVLDCTMETIPTNGACTPDSCVLWRDPKDCLAETKAFKAALRAKTPKPTGYTWRLWHDPKPRDPKPLPGPGTYPSWAWGTPAKTVASILAAAKTPGPTHQAFLAEYDDGSHPWIRSTPLADDDAVTP